MVDFCGVGVDRPYPEDGDPNCSGGRTGRELRGTAARVGYPELAGRRNGYRWIDGSIHFGENNVRDIGGYLRDQ